MSKTSVACRLIDNRTGEKRTHHDENRLIVLRENNKFHWVKNSSRSSYIIVNIVHRIYIYIDTHIQQTTMETASSGAKCERNNNNIGIDAGRRCGTELERMRSKMSIPTVLWATFYQKGYGFSHGAVFIFSKHTATDIKRNFNFPGITMEVSFFSSSNR